MNAIAPANASITMCIATQATALEQGKIEGAVDVAVLSSALDLEKEMAADILKSLGLGQNLDLLA